jgi:hypothetical protein
MRWYVRAAVLVLASACVDLTQPPGLVTDRDSGLAGAGAGGSARTGGAGGSSDGGGDRPLPEGGESGSAGGGAGGDSDGNLPVDAPLLAVGSRCSLADQCASGFCAEGFCCDGACTDLCQSCALAGREGMCTSAPNGQDPRNQCDQDPAAGCARNGSCDGKGACARYAARTECAPGRCSASVEYAASTCDGKGACVAGTSRSCSPGICMGSSCASSCTTQADCLTGFFCDAGKCVVSRSNGAACTLPGQCASGQCVDGVCCKTACTEACSACNLGSSAGTCTAIADGQDPQKECPAELPTTCGRAGGCNGRGGCRLYIAGTACAGQSCNNFTQINARSCDGAGVCLSGSNRDCSPYLCSGAGCATSCSSNSGCRPGSYCSSGACVAFGVAPVLHWKLDESGGGTADDASGNGNVGSYFGSSGTPTASTQRPPVSFTNPFSRAFVASNRQAVRLSPAPTIIKPANNLTISLWFRTTLLDLGHNPPAASEAISQNDNYFLRIRADDVAFTRRGAGTYITCFGVVSNHLDGNWHHAAGVLSPAGMKVYVDGIERCSNTRGEPMLYDKGPDLFVGRHPSSPDWDFDGNLDDVRIYDRALPAGEIAALAAGL